MSDPNRLTSPSRRGFAKSLALAAAAPTLVGAGAALGQTPPRPSPTPAPAPTPEAPSSAAEALTEVVRIRWGRNLSGEQLSEIAKTLDSRLKGADAMRKVALTNADEPDFVFSADVEEGR